MRLLTVPNWSFGRDPGLLDSFASILAKAPVVTHYCKADYDHNRTVTGFSGGPEAITATLWELALAALPQIDLNHHEGVHPRIGALDVCPFVQLGDSRLNELLTIAEDWAKHFAGEFRVPVYLYEKSEKGRHESDLPSLRKGGFAGALGRVLTPDYGPHQAHPRWGVTVTGVRDFLLAVNVNLKSDNLAVAKAIAGEIRKLRETGDPIFAGVRSLGFPLPSRGLVQVSLNFTKPDLTKVDPLYEWVVAEAAKHGVDVDQTELIGVIREKDLPGAGCLNISLAQVV